MSRNKCKERVYLNLSLHISTCFGDGLLFIECEIEGSDEKLTGTAGQQTTNKQETDVNLIKGRYRTPSECDKQATVILYCIATANSSLQDFFSYDFITVHSV